VAWQTCSEPDDGFLSDAKFQEMLGGDALIGITGGAPAMLEPVMLRSICPRDTFAWKRGETTATAGELMAFNGITAEAIAARSIQLLG
jgi:phosphoketolase